jgi:hypothetical protein
MVTEDTKTWVRLASLSYQSASKVFRICIGWSVPVQGNQILYGISSHQHIVAAVFIRTVALFSPTDYSIIIVAAVIVDGWFISWSSVVLVPDISFSFDGFPILHILMSGHSNVSA